MGDTMFHVVNAYTRGDSLKDYRLGRVTGSRRLEEWCWGW
jgi:hypothetical protein